MGANDQSNSAIQKTIEKYIVPKPPKTSAVKIKVKKD